MAITNGLFTLALSALMFLPMAATAADGSWGPTHRATPIAVGEPAPGRSSYRPAPPPPPARPAYSHGRGSRDGRYELQTVHTDVPGRYEQVWVAEQCTYVRRHVRSCDPGHYEQRWVPGYTQTSQQWVWVPYGRGPRGYGRG